jgi:17 kDa outer membrane surface antigen
MHWLGSSYIAKGPPRQSLYSVRLIAAALLIPHLVGCTGLASTSGQAGVDFEGAIGSITTADSKEKRSVAPSDWETVKRSIAQATSDNMRNGILAWQNPETGSTGTLKLLDTLTATESPDCRNFQTTVNDVRGIRNYRGEACRIEKNRWELIGVLADDSKLL